MDIWGVTRTSGGNWGITFRHDDYTKYPFPLFVKSKYYWVSYPKQLILPVGVL